MAVGRQLSVKFDTEGFNQAIQALQNTGKAFNTVLATAQQASRKAADALKSAVAGGDAKAAADAQKQLDAAAKATTRAIAASYRELGIKSSESLNQLRAQAVSAFEAIKNSGTASARDIANAQQALNSKLKDLEEQMKGTKNAFKDGFNLGQGVVISTAAIEALRTAIGGLASVASSSLREFTSFDDAIRAFGVTSQSTKEEIALVRAEVERLGIVTSKSPTEVAQMSVELARAGFTAKETATALEGIIRASEATGENLSTVGDIIGKTLRQFKLPAEESGRVADLLVQTANASNTSISGLGESLKFVGTTAATSNQNLEDVLAVLGLMGNAGLQGGQGGRNFAAALEKVALASAGATDELVVTSKGMKTAGEAVKALGIDFRDSQGNLRPFMELLPEIQQRLKTLSRQDQDVIFKILFGTEGGRAVRATLQATGKDVDYLVGKIQNAGGVAVRSGEQMNAGLGGALRLLGGSIKSVQTKFAAEFAPAAQAVVSAVAAIANAFLAAPAPIQKLIVAVASLAAGFAALVVAIAGFTAVSGVVTAAFTGMAAAVTALATAIGTGLVTALGLLLSPIGLVVAAIAAVAAGLVVAYQKSETFREAVNFLGQVLLTVAQDALRTIQRVLTELGNVIKATGDAFKSFAGIVGQSLNNTLNAIAQFGNSTIKFVTDIANWIGSIDLFKPFIDSAVRAAEGIKEAFSTGDGKKVGDFLSDGPLGLLGIKPISGFRDYLGGLFGRTQNRLSSEATDRSNLGQTFEAPKLAVPSIPAIAPGKISSPGSSGGSSTSGSGGSRSSKAEDRYQSQSVGIPLKGRAPVTSEFGWRTNPVTGKRQHHNGIDYGVPTGTSVYSTLSGQVVSAGWDKGGGGNTVTVKTVDRAGKEIIQSFLHLSQILVEVGDRIEKGQPVGKVGSTGRSTGPHLDWRAKVNGQWINPRSFQKMSFDVPSQSRGSRSSNEPQLKPLTEKQKTAAALIQVADRMGINPEDLLRVALYETGGTLNTGMHPKSKSGASGLIGFLPSTAKYLGSNIDAIRNMSGEEQAKYVEMYLRKRSFGKPLNSLEKLSSTVYGGNPGVPLDSRPGGGITVRQYAGRARDRYSKEAQELIKAVDSARGEAVEQSTQQQKRIEEEQAQVRSDIQSARTRQIEDLKTEILRTGETERRKIEAEGSDRTFQLKKAQLEATDDATKQSIDESIRLQELSTTVTLKQLELAVKRTQAETEIAVLERDRSSLSDQEKRRLEDLKYEQSQITEEIKSSNAEYERSLQLQQAQTDSARRTAIAQLQQSIAPQIQEISQLMMNDSQRAIAQFSEGINQKTNELLAKLGEANSLGDAESANQINQAIAQLGNYHQQYLNQKIQELQTQEQLNGLTTEQAEKLKALSDLQTTYAQKRQELEALLSEATKNNYTEQVTALESLITKLDQWNVDQRQAIADRFDEMKQLYTSVTDAARSSLEGFFTDLFTNTRSLGDALGQLFRGILTSIGQIAAKNVTAGIFKVLGFSKGGIVPGVDRGYDSVPAMLRPGEIVLPPDISQNLLDSIGSGVRSPQLAFESMGRTQGGGKSATVIMNVTTPDANSFRRSETQIGRDAGEQYRRAVQRNG